MDEKLSKLENQVQQLKIDKARYEEKLSLLRQQKDTIIKTLSELGIEPKNLQEHINTLETDIKTNLESIEKQIPSLP